MSHYENEISKEKKLLLNFNVDSFSSMTLLPHLAVHYLPCHIHYDGPAKVSSYFKVYEDGMEQEMDTRKSLSLYLPYECVCIHDSLLYLCCC